MIQEGQKEEEMFQPLFVTRFKLDPWEVLCSPDEEEFQEGIADIMNVFQQASLEHENLVTDSYFDAFTRSDNRTYRRKSARLRLL